MPSTATQVEAFRTDTGCLIRVVGRGSMRESRVCHDYARRCLEAAEDRPVGEGPFFTIDLSECERLDSTFLGCLVDLHKRFNRGGDVRFTVVAPLEVARELLSVSRLDRLLPVRSEAPPTRGEGTSLVDHLPANAQQLGRHVMECHRRLAEQGGPTSEVFARIADQLEKELEELERQQT